MTRLTRRVRDESGFALIVTMMLLLIALTIGAALVARSDSQSKLSGQERTREGSFALAESALNAEALALSRSWPGSTATTSPTSCTPSSSSTLCPPASAVGGGYTGSDFASSCRSAPSTPLWQTTVRDNLPGEQYWTSAVSTGNRAAYDLNNDGLLWVRSTASVQCDKVSMVSLASRSSVPMDFPANTISANWFATSNQGRKVIVDTLGTTANPPRPASQPAPISLRCNSAPSPCANYQTTKGQIQPPAVTTSSGAPASALSSTQIASLERQASAAGTLYTCPSSSTNLSSVNGAPVVITGPCNLSISSNTVINSSANPGVLVIENGTLSLAGTTTFYGLVYMLNRQNTSGAVVTIGGNASVQGMISVDGNGGVVAGSSKTNVIYDSRATSLLRGEAGAVLNKNSFRVLPPSTP
jgi:Tfp pilus assembly protein PilX